MDSAALVAPPQGPGSVMHNEGPRQASKPFSRLDIGVFAIIIFFVKPLSKFSENLPLRSIHLTKPPGLSHSTLSTPRLLAHFSGTMIPES